MTIPPQRGPEDQSEGGDPPVTVPKRFGGQFESSFLSPNVFISSQTRPVITQVVVQAQSTSGIDRSEIRLDSEFSPGLACESSSLSSPGASRSRSRSRPTNSGSV